jgi:transcriptional regulator with PAS, ATPase and Fis domain
MKGSDEKHVQNLLNRLIFVAEDVSAGGYGRHDEIFELTKTASYPPLIARLAEAFGLMLVKVEAREFHLEQVVEDLRKTQAQLQAGKQELHRENIKLKHNLRRTYAFDGIMGSSRAHKEVLAEAERVADTTANVLLLGETGTGKELLAKAIHFNSGRGDKPLVVINCSAIPESIFESEMFGIEKGVATGVEQRAGKIEAADGGTLFLDEIGDMPLPCQAKMLRAIEEREVERVGGRKTTRVDIRIIAATHKDLREEVRRGEFREDLFYRLNVVSLMIPPLRAREDDVLLLANSFIREYSRKYGRRGVRLAEEVVELFRKYPWPGNVRQLENEMERAMALAAPGSAMVTVTDLSEVLRKFDADASLPGRALPGSVAAAESELVRGALRESAGNKTLTAQKLGISREGLRKKMNRLGLK